MATPLKVCAYLDALNFYYRYSREYNFKWIDVHSLLLERLRDIGLKDIHLCVKIYTSNSVNPDARQRQQSYLVALKKAYGDEVLIIRGKHSQRKSRTHEQVNVNLAIDIVDNTHNRQLYIEKRSSNSINPDVRERQESCLVALKNIYGSDVPIIEGLYTQGESYTEKQTDVNLAIDIVDDAYKKDYDLGVLVSGDTDFVGALRKAKTLKYKMVLITPQESKNQELQELVRETYSIKGFSRRLFLRHSLSIKAGNKGKPESWRG